MPKRGWITSAFEVLPSAKATFRAAEKHNQVKHVHKKPNKDTDCKLWVEKYAPKTKEELVTHKKKVTQVEDALVHCCQGKTKISPVLLISGPSGAGKTATVHLLTKIHQIEVKEWANPLAPEWQQKKDEYPGQLVQSQGQQFWDFLLRANRYPSLNLTGKRQNHWIILVEDMPNVFIKNPSEFHALLRKFCLLNQSCIAFILNDDKCVAINELFPEHFKQELEIQHIRFNPVSATNMTKLLMKVSAAELSISLPKPTLNSMVHSGDVRMALNTMQFTFSSVCSSKGERAKKGSLPLSRGFPNEGSDGNLPMVFGGKDQSLFIYHALGKIMHCKRAEDQPTDAKLLPAWLHPQARYPLLQQPEMIVNNSTLSSESMTLFLHENTLKFFSTIKCAAIAVQHFSDAATLSSNWEAQDALEECCSLVAARGCMHGITATSGAGWQPFYKPAWYATNRKKQRRQLLFSHLQEDFKHLNQTLATEVYPFHYKILKHRQQLSSMRFGDELCTFPSSKSRNEEQLGKFDTCTNSHSSDVNDNDSTVIDKSRLSQQPKISFPAEETDFEDELEIEDSD